MPYDDDPIQGQGYGSPKAAKMADFKISFAGVYVIRRQMVNYDTPGQCLGCNQNGVFDIRPRSASRDLQT